MSTRFGTAETAPGAHRAAARHGAAHILETLLEAHGLAHLGQLVGEVAHQPLHVGLTEQRRHLAHHDGAAAERFQGQAQLGQLFRPLSEARRAPSRQPRNAVVWVQFS